METNQTHKFDSWPLSLGDDDCRPYDAIIKARKNKGGMAMGKHKAANAVCCERIIGQLELAGMLEERDWAVWMLWWRTMDWQTQQQVREMQQEEINRLKKVNADLKGGE